MKKRLFIPILIVLVFVLILSGCKKDPPEEESVPTPPPNNGEIEEVEEDERAQIMDDFLEVVEDKDPLIIKEFVDKNIGKLSQLDGNKMIDNLEKSLVDDLDGVTDSLLSKDEKGELMDIAGEELFFPQELVNGIEDELLKREVTTLFDTMYKLVNLEGNFYPIVDYERIAEEYNSYVTDEWKEYLAVRAMDSNQPPFIDGGLAISYSDLANRILKTENYLNKYLDSSRQEEMVDAYHNKITIYLKGIDNTPMADISSNRIYEDLMDSYISTSHNEGYITANILGRYVEAIEDNDNIIDEKILGLADELILEAVEILTEYK